MDDIWKILGIEPTNDKKKIRAAYAAKSKDCHPEEDPEAFVRLNQAYRSALQRMVSGGEKNEERYFQKPEPERRKSEKRQKTEWKFDGLNNQLKTEEPEPKKPQTKEPESEKQEPEEEAPSLLSLLAYAEEAKIEKSMDKGALKQFIAIFEKAKESGKVPRADVWKEFFLSEEFLKEQYADEFAKGMFQYLSDWSMEGNYHMKSLPDHFLVELAIAYALMPEQSQMNPDTKRMTYQVNATGFRAREAAAEIWNMQTKEYMPIRILYKPENLVRLRSFADYMRLRSLNEKNSLTCDRQETWNPILNCGVVNHLYEQKGRGQHKIYEQSRSQSLIRLYTFWLQNETVPACILEYMYRQYDLKNIAHTSRQKIYDPLKQEILRQYPEIEEALFAEKSAAQLISGWYRELSKIISDGEADYHQGIYEESEKSKERVQALFARPEWQKIRFLQELFDKMYLLLIGREVLPNSLAKRLLAHYSEEGVWKDEDKTAFLIEELLLHLANNRRLQEINGAATSLPLNASVEQIADDNAEFWHYYLMTGFGFRNADVEYLRQRKYMLGNHMYLPAYMKCLYFPSMQWQKCFTGFDEEEFVKPISMEFALPDARKLRVEFHLHYCLYFLDGKPVYEPEYTFEKCVEFAGIMKKTEHVFFLLAITTIGEEECSQARQMIEQWLSRLPLHPQTIPAIAHMLAEDHIREKEGAEMVQAIYYAEQEHECFKTVVTDCAILLYRQGEFGWLPESDSSKDDSVFIGHADGKEQAKELLKNVWPPRPVLLESVSLEGMDNEQKAIHIIESLIHYGTYRKGGGLPNEPGDLWEAARKFFREIGGLITESYCVLRYGTERTRKGVFYLAVHPYEMEAWGQRYGGSPDYRRRVEKLEQKVKEPHLIVGCMGISEEGAPAGEFVPEPFALGESGRFYLFDTCRMCRGENLAALLVKKFDLSKVCQVETYQGLLSISRFGQRLEYCYGEEELRESVHTVKKTTADLFVRFTKAEVMIEFGKWLDEVLQEADRMPAAYFRLELREKNKCSVTLYSRDTFGGHDEKCRGNLTSLSEGYPAFIWKIWSDDMPPYVMEDTFGSILNWYMEYGAFGWKLKSCLKIEVDVSLWSSEEEGWLY